MGTTNTSSFGRWIISPLLVRNEWMDSRLLEANCGPSVYT